MKKKPTNLACDSCRRLLATRRMLDGFLVDVCDECVASEFRRGRMLERAREREGAAT